jgi:hypothetical protein
VDWQFLGWRPTIADLIIATLLAALAERWWHWLYRLWSFLLDRIASLSDFFRARRIRALEVKIRKLKEYDDRKILIRFMQGICSLILFVGLITVVSVFMVENHLTLNTLEIIEYFKIPDSSFLGIIQSVPGFPIMIATQILYVLYVVLLFVMVGVASWWRRYSRKWPTSEIRLKLFSALRSASNV